MARILRSPGKYVQGPGVLAQAHLHLSALGDNICFLASPSGIERIRPQLDPGMTAGGLTCHYAASGKLCTRAEAERLAAEAKKYGCNVIAGVGGGTVLDLAKAVSYFLGLPVAIMPTVASSDAPCSALSVLYTEAGIFDEYLFLPKSPELVLVDSQQIVNAPAKLLSAGMGDAMATYFEARAVQRSGKNNQVGGRPTLSAQALARKSYETLIADGVNALMAVEQRACSVALENVIEANTYLSGVGFESGGLGAAHAIQKGFTTIPQAHDLYHGEIVAFGTLMHLVMENAPAEEVEELIRFFIDIRLPVTFAQLGMGNVTREQLMTASQFASRPGMTIHNMPFPICAEDVFAAFLMADALGRKHLGNKS